MKLKHFFLSLVAIVLLASCEKDAAVTGIAIDKSTSALTAVGQKDTLTATIAPSDASATITWASSNTAVATVVGNGKTAVITAVGAGTAKIVASADIFTAECAVTVTIGGGSTGDGDGTEAKPYNVAQAIVNQGASKWVEGYIVGYINGLNFTDATFAVPTAAETEILIATSATEKDPTKCIPVALPAGAVRDGLELFAKPTNLGKKVKLYGSLEAYFGKPGLKATSYFELEGGVTGGTKPTDTTGALLNETFATGQGQFTIVDVLKPAALTSIWYFNSTYKQMAAGAYKDNVNNASESWLISPTLNLSALSKATLIFEHAGKQYGAPVTNLTIQVSKVYTGGSINASDWTVLSIPNHLAGETNTFKSSGDIDLTPYCGNANVRIAFKYTSATTGAGNWYVKNVVVK